MRFMIIVKATKDSEAGVMPDEKLIADMATYHEELQKAGMLLDGSGLQASSKGWRIKYSRGKQTVVDGPFTETKELVAGYTLIQARSREEALEWTKRFPNPAIAGKDGEIEVRQLFELEDFEPAFGMKSEAVERFREMGIGAKPVPQGMHSVTPHLVCAGAADAIEFYKKAFNAVEEGRLPGPDGRLMHAMIRIAGSAVMLVDEMPEWGAFGPKSLKGSPVTIHLYVPHVDAFVKRAVAAGAKITMPLDDMFWGDRYCQLEDPFGHHWSVATHIRDVTPEEMRQAMQKMSRCPEGSAA